MQTVNFLQRCDNDSIPSQRQHLAQPVAVAATTTSVTSPSAFRAPVLCHRPVAVVAPLRAQPQPISAIPEAASSTTVLRHAPPPPPLPSPQPPPPTRRYRYRGRYLPVVSPRRNAEQSALLQRPSARVIELQENARGEYVIDEAQLDPDGLYVEEVWDDAAAGPGSGPMT